MRQVNLYKIPESSEATPGTKQGALKRIREVYEANKVEINRVLLEMQAAEDPRRRPLYRGTTFYDIFEQNVLDTLSAKYGGNDERDRIKKDKEWVENDVNIEEALDRTLRNRKFTSLQTRFKINFLNAIKKSHPSYWQFLQKHFAYGGATYEGISLDAITFDESTGEYIVLLPNGQRVRFVQERNSAGSYVWVMYYL